MIFTFRLEFCTVVSVIFVIHKPAEFLEKTQLLIIRFPRLKDIQDSFDFFVLLAIEEFFCWPLLVLAGDSIFDSRSYCRSSRCGKIITYRTIEQTRGQFGQQPFFFCCFLHLSVPPLHIDDCIISKLGKEGFNQDF